MLRLLSASSSSSGVRALAPRPVAACAALWSARSGVGRLAPAHFATTAASAHPAEPRHTPAATPVSAPAVASPPGSASPLVAPAFGTNDDTERRFVYIKGVKNDGRSKRFYARVDIEPVQTARGLEYGIQLDGRFVVTPYNQILSAPTLGAATAIAFEWDAQGDFLRPISMPLTNICVTAIDQAYTDRARFLTHFRSAIATDSVLLRVKAPSGLVHQQRKQWDTLLHWMKERYGCDLHTTYEFETPRQSAEVARRKQELLESLTGWQLAALDSLTTVTKSFVISWALLTSRLTIHQAFEAARLEENFQMRQYGQVDGVYGHGIEMEFTRLSIAAAKTWVNLVTTDTKANPLLDPHA